MCITCFVGCLSLLQPPSQQKTIHPPLKMSLQKSGEGGAVGSEEKKRLAPSRDYVLYYVIFSILNDVISSILYTVLPRSLGISRNLWEKHLYQKTYPAETRKSSSGAYVDLSGVYRV